MASTAKTTTKAVSSRDRWEEFNDLVDNRLPLLTNAQAVLLIYYFRHGRRKKSNGEARTVFAISDSRAAKDLGKHRQTIKKLRIGLVSAGVVHSKPHPVSGKLNWYIGEKIPPNGGEA